MAKPSSPSPCAPTFLTFPVTSTNGARSAKGLGVCCVWRLLSHHLYLTGSTSPMSVEAVHFSPPLKPPAAMVFPERLLSPPNDASRCISSSTSRIKFLQQFPVVLRLKLRLLSRTRLRRPPLTQHLFVYVALSLGKPSSKSNRPTYLYSLKQDQLSYPPLLTELFLHPQSPP